MEIPRLRLEDVGHDTNDDENHLTFRRFANIISRKFRKKHRVKSIDLTNVIMNSNVGTSTSGEIVYSDRVYTESILDKLKINIFKDAVLIPDGEKFSIFRDIVFNKSITRIWGIYIESYVQHNTLSAKKTPLYIVVDQDDAFLLTSRTLPRAEKEFIFKRFILSLNDIPDDVRECIYTPRTFIYRGETLCDVYLLEISNPFSGLHLDNVWMIGDLAVFGDAATYISQVKDVGISPKQLVKLIADIGMQLFRVILYLHSSAGYVHRDIKPHNILVFWSSVNQFDISESVNYKEWVMYNIPSRSLFNYKIHIKLADWEMSSSISTADDMWQKSRTVPGSFDYCPGIITSKDLLYNLPRWDKVDVYTIGSSLYTLFSNRTRPGMELSHMPTMWEWGDYDIEINSFKEFIIGICRYYDLSKIPTTQRLIVSLSKLASLSRKSECNMYNANGLTSIPDRRDIFLKNAVKSIEHAEFERL